ncbi:MAG: hypothetical protein KDD04_11245, partial [Sinomicrobium sp.]|nr:hypothetical protein [Sinomicrobium sp.]
KIFDLASGSAQADEKAHQIVAGSDIDYTVMRLAALFQKNTGKNDRFAAAMTWLSAGSLDKADMEYRYELVRGKTIAQDLEDSFGKNTLQYVALKQIYNEGKLSKSAELALELGLLYEGSFFGPGRVHKMDKDRVHELVKESFDDFAFLADESAIKDIFQKKTYDYLKNNLPGFFGELRNLVSSRTAALKNDPGYTFKPDKQKIRTGNRHADYLISLVRDIDNPYNISKPTTTMERPVQSDKYREFDKHKVTSRIFEWAGKADENIKAGAPDDTSVPLKELEEFVKSGEAFTKNKNNSGAPSPYTKVWEILAGAPQARIDMNRKFVPRLFGGFSEERLTYL